MLPSSCVVLCGLAVDVLASMMCTSEASACKHKASGLVLSVCCL